MAATELVERDIQLGEKAWRALHEDFMLGAYATLWWYDEDASDWRFLVASRCYDTKGPKKAYSRIQAILKRHGLSESLPINRVVALSPHHPLVKLLRGGPVDFSGEWPRNIGLRNVNILGTDISGAHIYTIDRAAASKPVKHPQPRGQRSGRRPRVPSVEMTPSPDVQVQLP